MTDTAKLKERLRRVSEYGGTHLDGLWSEAADAIARLEAELAPFKIERFERPPEMGSGQDRDAMGWVRYVDHCEAVQQVAAQRDEAFRLLGISAERFRFYESQHRNNGTPHGDRMAEINAEQAAEIETFLAKTQGGGADE